MKSLAYTSAYIVPFTAVLGASLGGTWAFLTPIFYFVLTPMLDELLPKSRANPTAEQEAEILADKSYDSVLAGYVLLQVLSLSFGIWVATVFAHTPLEWVGLIVSFGIVGGSGINVAHELMHRSKPSDRALAEILTTSVSYTHFCIEHVYGHHKRVATSEDPATSRLGEPIYRFVCRSIIGGFKSFLEIEKTLVASRRLAWYSLRDRRNRYGLVWLLVVSTVYVYAGWPALGFFLGQSVVAFCMLEIVNYLEHYGLERVEIAPGRYQKIQLEHSWNSPHRVTGLFLFGLPRHADHHHKASKPYSILQHHEEAPQLPAGYATMFLLALVPPLWRSVMDHRVEALRQRGRVEAASNGDSMRPATAP